MKAFKSVHQITCLNYGPYDNGHILIGLDNGNLLVYNGNDMSKLCQIEVFKQGLSSPVTSLTFEPTKLVIAACKQTQEVAVLTFI